MLVLFSVLMMRYNVVIGGQEIAKTGKGLLAFQFEVFGKDGLITAACVLIAPLILLAVMVRVLPPWHDPEPEQA
jgi:predicted membrane protein